MSPYSVFDFTIPAAGVTENFQATGQSIIILDMPTYTAGNEPEISFDSPGGSFPLSAQSVYNSGKQKFSKLVVTGTAESAGDVVTVLVTNECLATSINFNNSINRKALPGTSFIRALDNTTDNFTAVDLINADGLLPSKIIVSVRGGDAVYLIDPDLAAIPAQTGGTGLGSVIREPDDVDNLAGDLIEIEGIAFILAFRFRALVAGETPVMTVHLEY